MELVRTDDSRDCINNSNIAETRHSESRYKDNQRLSDCQLPRKPVVFGPSVLLAQTAELATDVDCKFRPLDADGSRQLEAFLMEPDGRAIPLLAFAGSDMDT